MKDISISRFGFRVALLEPGAHVRGFFGLPIACLMFTPWETTAAL